MISQEERETIKDYLHICQKKVDPNLSFNEQVDYLRKKLSNMLKNFEETISVDDLEVLKMIKESVVIMEEKPIVFDKGYNPWLNDERINIPWNYYNRYEKYLLEKKGWSWGAIQSIKTTSDIILDHMHNPKSNEFFGIKGLVMGDIQSGKTASYTALINKSLDCGYKLIIVLAGMTKDLRSQTQKRLDKEVLGYTTSFTSQKGKTIGVGEINDGSFIVNAITNSDDNGDLKKTTANAITTVLSEGMNPFIAVLKKNSGVLNALLSLLSNTAGSKTNEKFDIPVLIIDDEVDQASPNTKNNTSIEEASSINRLIRKILNKFNRFSYVGYTATPFANVFINPYEFEGEEKDIFPEDFIICLPKPIDYCGVSEYFGIDTIGDDDSNDAIELDLFREIDDYYDLFDGEVNTRNKVKVDTSVVCINSSMKEAFMHFIIASAIKYSRGIIEHNSMLIHLERFKNTSTSIKELVFDTVSQMARNYKYGDETDKDELKEYWENNIKPISKKRLLKEYNDNWENIEKHINNIFDMTLQGIKVINGDSEDICDYDSSNVGQHIIIGGDKLSRGLTLNGLIVSYYHRQSRTYDALLQMGRWFGYKNGWIDLCRIYTEKEQVNNFINAGIATEMFKKDIDEMNSLNLEPVNFGMKVRYSPRLAPTSASKMKTATKQKISFSSTLQQLISFQKEFNDHNRNITDNFLKRLGNSYFNVHSNNNVFRNVSSEIVLDYLRQYKECEEPQGTISIKNWINYIVKSNERGEMIDWTIVLHSALKKRGTEENEDIIGGYSIYKNSFSDRNLYANDEDPILHLKAITTPSDFREFYLPESKEYRDINEYNAANVLIKNTFTKKHALMAIYDFDVHKKEFDYEEISLKTNKKNKHYKQGDVLDGGKGIIGLGVWFPDAEGYDDSAVYYVNPIYMDMNREVGE